jgi:hypothetical protein
VRDGGGRVFAEGWIAATRFDLDRWMKALSQPWSAALEATAFSGWIYDHLAHFPTRKPSLFMPSRCVAGSEL